jgi:hypothetical protein
MKNVGLLIYCLSLVSVAQYAGYIDLRSSADQNCDIIVLNKVIIIPSIIIRMKGYI